MWCILPWYNSPYWARTSSLLWLHDPRHTKIGMTALDEWSARHRSLPDNTQQSQKTEIQPPGGIRTHIPSKRATADLSLRKRDHWDCPYGVLCRKIGHLALGRTCLKKHRCSKCRCLYETLVKRNSLRLATWETLGVSGIEYNCASEWRL